MRGNRSLTTVFAVAVAVAAVGCTRTTVGTPIAAAGTPTVMSPPAATVMSPPTDIDSTVRRIGEDVTAWWSRNGVDIGPIEYALTTADITCGGDTVTDEALFCHHRSGGGVAKFRAQAMTQLHRETGDVGVEIVVAHELGHGVQYAAHTDYRSDTLAELSADCFAGAYLAASGAEFRDVMDTLPHTQLTVTPGAGTAIEYGGGEISSGIVGKSLIDHCLNYRP